MAPERALVANDAAEVARLLDAWAGPRGWPDPDAADQYRQAMTQSPTAFCWMETFRWLVRSLPRSDGRRWMRRTAAKTNQPTLLINGDHDPLALAAADPLKWLGGPARAVSIEGVGHFPQEESAQRVSEELTQFLSEQG